MTKHRKYKIAILLLVLPVIVLIAYHLYLSNQIEKSLDVLRDKGLPVTSQELQKSYVFPASDKNAAEVLSQAFSFLIVPQKDPPDLPVFNRQCFLPKGRDVMNPKTKAAINAFLKQNAQAIAYLHKGAALTESRYPIDLSLGMNTLLPHVSFVRNSVRTLYLDAVINLENTNSDAAVKDICSMLGVASSLSKEPIMVSAVVKIACQESSASCLQYVLNRISLNDSQLAQLSVAFENSQKEADMTMALAGEICIMRDIYQNPEIYFQMFKGSSRPGNDILSKILWSFRTGGRGIYYRTTGITGREYLRYIKVATEYVDASKLSTPERIRTAKEIDAKINIDPDSPLRAPSFLRVMIVEANTIASLRSSVTALAVERYRLAKGKLPEKLAELVPAFLEKIPEDPFDGKPLRYKKIKNGYIIYSIGEDIQDNGGTEKDKQKSPDDTDTDITFVVKN